MGWGWTLIWNWLRRGGGGRLFKAGRLLTFSTFRMGAYSRQALIRGWALIRINTVSHKLNKAFRTDGVTLRVSDRQNELSCNSNQQTVNVWLNHVSKFSLYMSFAIYFYPEISFFLNGKTQNAERENNLASIVHWRRCRSASVLLACSRRLDCEVYLFIHAVPTIWTPGTLLR